MVDYKKVGSKTITGKKTPVSVYKKSGSNKLYVKRSGKMVSYVTYKKSFAKKLLGNTLKKVKKTKATPRRRYTMGGDCSSSPITGGFMSEYFNEPPTSETEKMTIDFNNLGKEGLNGFMGTNNTTGGKNNKRNNNQKRNNNRNNNPNSYHNYGGYYEEEVEQNDKYENEQPKETYQNTMEGGRKKHGKRKSSLKVHKKSKKSNNKRRV